ncbi:hypothetical protein ACMFMG_006051 [Clarireedia jacksonii]
MTRPPGAIAMNTLGNSSGVSAASPVQHIASPSASGSQNSGSNSAAVNLGTQTPRPDNADDKPAPNPNTAMRCVKFLACWDCGPIGTIVAFITFVVGTILSYYTIQLAIWTATKDYIEHCQSDQVYSYPNNLRSISELNNHKEAQRATIQCQEAAGRPLPPPPFFKHDPTNSTVYRRTLVGGLIGATPSRHYNSLFVWLYALLLHAISWMGLSAMCYLAYSLARATWQTHSSSWRPRPHPARAPQRARDELDDFRAIASSSSNAIQSDSTENMDSTTTLRRRANAGLVKMPRIRVYPHCPRTSQLNAPFPDRYEDIVRRWTQQGASFRPSMKSKVETRQKDSNFASCLRRLQGNTLRAVWFKKWCTGADISVQLLHNLYGLEVSICTGNSRRISLIELIFTAPMKRYLKPILQGSFTFVNTVFAAIEDKDPIRFLECYTKHPYWRDDFVRLIQSYLNVLADTGVNLEGDLNALYASKNGDPVMVTIPKNLYPWAKTLKDSGQSFTLAVFSDMSLCRS